MDRIECGLHTDCPHIDEVCLRGICTRMEEASPCRDLNQINSCPAGLVCYTSQGRCRDLHRTPLDLKLPYIHPNSRWHRAPVFVELRDCPAGSYVDGSMCRSLAMSGEQCTESIDCVETHVCHQGKCAQTCLTSSQCTNTAGNESCVDTKTLYAIDPFTATRSRAGGVCLSPALLDEAKWRIDRANSTNPIKCSLDSDCLDPLCSCYHGACSTMAKGSPCRSRNGKLVCPGLLECDQGLCRDRYDSKDIYANCPRGTADVPGDNMHCRVLGDANAACTDSSNCLESHICHKLKCVKVCFETSECIEPKPETKKAKDWTCYNPYLEQTNVSRSNNRHGGGICQLTGDLSTFVHSDWSYNISYKLADDTQAKAKVSETANGINVSTAAMVIVASVVGLMVFIFVIVYIRRRRRRRTLRLYF